MIEVLKDMKVLGRAYKENLALGIVMAVVAVGLFVALGAVLFDPSPLRITLSVFFFTVALGVATYFTVIIVLQVLTKENVILFDENELNFTVNRYRRKYTINLSEINCVICHDNGVLTFGPLFFRAQLGYGKIEFRLNGGKRVITPNIEDVLKTHGLIANLIKGKGES